MGPTKDEQEKKRKGKKEKGKGKKTHNNYRNQITTTSTTKPLKQ
jgi:hypothetical protein